MMRVKINNFNFNFNQRKRVTFLFIIPWYWENSLSSLLFDMTVWVAGSTHSVLLPMNVILGKECEESNSPTPRKWTFLLDWNFFEQLWRHREKAITFAHRFGSRKTSKKNTRYYSRDYFYWQKSKIYFFFFKTLYLHWIC